MSFNAFDNLMTLDDTHIRLDCAALHLARDAFPGISPIRYLRRLDDLADEVAEMRPGLSATLRYEALRDVLVARHGLSGNQDDYYDPANSYLNCVLDRGLGTPISLSVVWMEVARRLKWPNQGIGLPGHFIIRLDDPERYVLADPFREGRTLTLADCRNVVAHTQDGKVPFSPSFLQPVGVRYTLRRMLNNLRSIYFVNHDWPRLANVLRRLATVEPENGRHIRELAAISYASGDFYTARAHLSAYLQARPGARDRKEVQQQLAHLDATVVSMN